MKVGYSAALSEGRGIMRPQLAPPSAMHWIQSHPSEISPELVLVDPELRARLLSQLASSDVPDVLRVRPRVVVAQSAAGSESVAPSDTRERAHGKRRRSVLGALIAASLTINVLFVYSKWNDDVRSAAVPVAARADSTTASSPLPTTTTTQGLAAPTISWQPVAGASYYNLVVWRGHRRILDLWPTSTRVILPGAWDYRGQRGSVSPGRYLWFAYPGFGPKTSAHYGTPVQNGVLIVNDTKGIS
jgi:hypothetical protein